MRGGGGGGGGEKTKKKFMQGKMPRKKNSRKGEGKEKNSCRRKVQFLDFTSRHGRHVGVPKQ